jgi:hypothetical protein
MAQVAYMYNDPLTIPHSMMSLAMPSLVVMLVLQEEVLVRTVSSESDRRYSQAGEAASKSVEPREWTIVSPSLSKSYSQ